VHVLVQVRAVVVRLDLMKHDQTHATAVGRSLSSQCPPPPFTHVDRPGGSCRAHTCGSRRGGSGSS
jgi:hypothetical protein